MGRIARDFERAAAARDEALSQLLDAQMAEFQAKLAADLERFIPPLVERIARLEVLAGVNSSTENGDVRS